MNSCHALLIANCALTRSHPACHSGSYKASEHVFHGAVVALSLTIVLRVKCSEKTPCNSQLVSQSPAEMAGICASVRNNTERKAIIAEDMHEKSAKVVAMHAHVVCVDARCAYFVSLSTKPMIASKPAVQAGDEIL